MQDLIEKVDNAYEDCSPEIYKDYKELKANIADQRDENADIRKTLEKIEQETLDQNEKM